MLMEQNEATMDPKVHDRELGPDDTAEPRQMRNKQPMVKAPATPEDGRSLRGDIGEVHVLQLLTELHY